MLSILLALGPAYANGQTSHLWITEAAVLALPEGELKDLLSRDDIKPYLRNGAMFPDGGYPLGDDYAEIAHWEPFQGLYLEWIQSQWQAPYPLEAEQHIAFLFGMASHGMADQVYDSFYLEKARGMDAESDWESYSNDQATDIVFASLTGPQEVPEDVVPYQTLVDLYAEYGYTVTTDRLEQGQGLLQLAVTVVGNLGQDPESVAENEALFPWSTAHQLDEAQRGNPPVEASVVALYWQGLWSRLGGADFLDDPVIATLPGSEAEGLPLSAAEYDARPGVVFARGLAEEPAAGVVEVRDASGASVPVGVDLYYGYSSHVLLLVPEGDWVADEVYTVTIGADVTFLDGRTLGEPWSFTFRAGDPVIERNQTPVVSEEEGCGCAQGGGGRLWLLVGLAGLGLGRRRA